MSDYIFPYEKDDINESSKQLVLIPCSFVSKRMMGDKTLYEHSFQLHDILSSWSDVKFDEFKFELLKNDGSSVSEKHLFFIESRYKIPDIFVSKTFSSHINVLNRPEICFLFHNIRDFSKITLKCLSEEKRFTFQVQLKFNVKKFTTCSDLNQMELSHMLDNAKYTQSISYDWNEYSEKFNQHQKQIHDEKMKKAMENIQTLENGLVIANQIEKNENGIVKLKGLSESEFQLVLEAKKNESLKKYQEQQEREREERAKLKTLKESDMESRVINLEDYQDE